MGRTACVCGAAVLAVCVLFASGCNAPSTRDDGSGLASKSYEPEWSAEDLARLEEAVLRDGHQPWRLDPQLTAQAALAHVLQSECGASAEEAQSLAASESDWAVRQDSAGHRLAIWTGRTRKAELELQNSRPGDETGVWYCTRATIR